MNDRIYYKVIRNPDRTSLCEDAGYKFTYPKRGKIKCNHDSLGFFMFETLKQANEFRKVITTSTAVIKVKCLAEVKKPTFIALLPYLTAFYYYYRRNPFFSILITHTIPPPKGSVCCEYIEIL